MIEHAVAYARELPGTMGVCVVCGLTLEIRQGTLEAFVKPDDGPVALFSGGPCWKFRIREERGSVRPCSADAG